MPGPSRALLRPVSVAVVVLVVVAALLGYRVARDSIAATVYRQRLAELHEQHAELTQKYNDAVTRAAVTELLVSDGTVRVLVRSGDEATGGGVLEAFDTPYDPAGEVFIDYAVLDGKLWIRRVFDEHTPPNQGTLIDPALNTIDWDDASARHGKVAYRSLTDGRWVVSVSGDGSVGLRKVSDDTEVALVSKPAVQEFDPVQQAQAEVDRIGFGEVVRGLLR